MIYFNDSFHVILFFFILIKVFILTPVDTPNLAVGCSPSYVNRVRDRSDRAKDRSENL